MTADAAETSDWKTRPPVPQGGPVRVGDGTGEPTAVIAIIDPEAAAAAEGAADRGDCPKHPGNSGLWRGCRQCVLEEIAAAKAAEIAAATHACSACGRQSGEFFVNRDGRLVCVRCTIASASRESRRWARLRTAGTVADIVLTLALVVDLYLHHRAAQPAAPAAAGQVR